MVQLMKIHTRRVQRGLNGHVHAFVEHVVDDIIARTYLNIREGRDLCDGENALATCRKLGVEPDIVRDDCERNGIAYDRDQHDRQQLLRGQLLVARHDDKAASKYEDHDGEDDGELR